MTELSTDVVEEAERLTRLARTAVDGDEAAAYRERRASLLAEWNFTARVREEDDTLVLHPAEWLDDDGTVRIDRIEDTDRAVEVPLTDPDQAEEWALVEEHNSALVDAVADEHGGVHAANVRAFANFMGNYYARRVETATTDEVAEFLSEYYPRNVWPSDDQKAVVEESLGLLFDAAGAEAPDLTAARR